MIDKNIVKGKGLAEAITNFPAFPHADSEPIGDEELVEMGLCFGFGGGSATGYGRLYGGGNGSGCGPGDLYKSCYGFGTHKTAGHRIYDIHPAPGPGFGI